MCLLVSSFVEITDLLRFLIQLLEEIRFLRAELCRNNGHVDIWTGL
jgi:hypothetical protein